MSDHWQDLGECTDLDEIIANMATGGILSLLPSPTVHLVRNTDTGEERKVVVGRDQSVGEAVAKGQWADDD